MISHTCRLSYQLYIPSNRIVKPNNRYARQPASHDFLFYSAPDKAYALTTTNRIAMRFAVRSVPPFRYLADSSDNAKGGIVSGTAVRRFAILRITPTIPKAELEAAHSRRRNLKRLTAAKTADMISHACRLIFINITLSNRIVKPNNRYTRQPASHDFPFYSAHDKVYVLTATNRIAMRFIPRCRPPFCYTADNPDYSKGGT